MSEEGGWLVERQGLTGPLYWSGTVFSGDAGEALRFSRKVDAERAIERLALANAVAVESKRKDSDREWVKDPRPDELCSTCGKRGDSHNMRHAFTRARRASSWREG